ncbi:uncharacterized protein DUF3164 [Pseudomonas sp. SLBN-26]|uniref:DUF3164 family protein n=1 Tax=Pseudomonadaceae TaxID=135621 RepID=UPI0011521E18|nr:MULTISPECIES: DUF3164 family protein [Pseudomonas]MCP1616598.1 aminopeptidase N [Pseudomonas otitidis]TQL05854.1 uncharacterized protein DUF3164 [Pseudomonas sp. SLBN-26]
MQSPEIQPGLWRDAQGRLVPIEMIKPIDLERDRLVRQLVGRAYELNQELAQFKAAAFGDVDAFVDLSAEQYDVHLGGKKGNVTLVTFDGRYKVIRAKADSIVFDERLQAARALIDECLADWTVGARSEVKLLINDAFRTDTKGEIRTASVLALRRLAIEDERWKRAMTAIGEACQVASTTSYLRLYERVGDTDQYVPISLDIAKINPEVH